MIYIASDHAGFKLKQSLIKWFKRCGFQHIDCGANSFDSLDSYVDYGKLAVDKFEKLSKFGDKLVLICGSGVGMSIVANRNKNIRAVLAQSKSQVVMARKHNDVNCLCLGARNTGLYKAKLLIKTFISTQFLGGKYLERLKNI